MGDEKRNNVIRVIVVILLTLWSVRIVAAQNSAPQVVEVEAADGLMLSGSYYPTEAESGVVVLLLHEFSLTSSVWQPVIEPLVQAGHPVLAVDMRGHGETEGVFDLALATQDIQAWQDWLSAQAGVTGVAVVGAGLGGQLALMACGVAEETCVAAIAISPVGNVGCDDCGSEETQFGADGAASLAEGTTTAIELLRRRSVLLVASHFDTESKVHILEWVGLSRGEISVHLFPAAYKGTGFVTDAAPTRAQVTGLIVDWLAEHGDE
jgi:pimeloyl-ACP methyl ester carboxylesterase